MNNCCNLREYIRNIIENNYNYFMRKKNVIGMGYGYKRKNAIITNQQCLIIFVTNKLPLNQLSCENVIPNVYKKIYTDVIQCNMPVASSLTTKIRPITGGYVVGVKKFDPGSMGCLVADSRNDYILTCTHVILGTTERKIGETINLMQPPPQYGGKIPRDEVGMISNYISVKLDRDNTVDAAIAIVDRSTASPDITFLGLVRGINKAKLNEPVKKVGAISGLTTGTITALDARILINFSGQEVMFKNQLITTKMSVQGDSGALMVNKNMEALGLLVANSTSNTVYNNIQLVLERLNVYIVRR